MKLIALLSVMAVAVLVATPAGAIVPPRNCSTITVGGKKYSIKSDQLQCPTARKYATTYLRSKRKPSGYVCAKGPSGSSLVFRCVAAKFNPDRTFFAIKR